MRPFDPVASGANGEGGRVAISGDGTTILWSTQIGDIGKYEAQAALTLKHSSNVYGLRDIRACSSIV